METDRISTDELEKWKTAVAWQSAIMAARSAGVTSWASLCVNSIILANSASAGGLLAFLAASKAPEAVLRPALASICAFGGGVFCGLLAVTFAYLSNKAALERDFLPRSDIYFKAHDHTATAWARIAGIFVILGLASFPVGALLGLAALGIHGGILTSG